MNKTVLGVKNRLWIVSEKETFLGDGRIALLQAIKQHGSITKAASSMSMSYLKAWKLIDSMNNVSKKPLVIRVTGGKGGGGTTLTKEGDKAITLYNELNMKSQQFLNTELKKLIEKF
jgi:molybdate transport system regulatory protein